MQPNDNPLCGYLSSSEILKMFQISRSSLWLWEKEKKFPQGFKIGRQKKWLIKDVLAFQNKITSGEIIL